jgi:hypothetical protein
LEKQLRQGSLFDDAVTTPSRQAVPVLGIIGGAASSKAQKQFNKLIDRLRGQRRELERWQAFRQVYQQQLAADYQPLAGRLREKRIALAKLLDHMMDATALGRRERDALRGILHQLLSSLLTEAADASIVQLHDKYAATSFGEAQRDRMQSLRSLASEAFGVNVEAYQGGESPEELTDWLEEQLASRPEQYRSQSRKKSAKALEREVLREQAAEGGTRAVREVYRKLVSELHPDREADPAEQARKTELMQRVNLAYGAGDLLGLLELQLSTEQIDSAALAGLAEERLRHYIHVLEEQSRQLRQELADLVAPFTMVLGDSMPRKVTPEAVLRALAADIRELKDTLRNVEADLLRLRDIRQLKQTLRQYRDEPSDDDDWRMRDEFRPGPRRRR